MNRRSLRRQRAGFVGVDLSSRRVSLVQDDVCELPQRPDHLWSAETGKQLLGAGEQRIRRLKIAAEHFALRALELLEIDTAGFDKMDRAILSAVIDKFGGGPVGVDTLAAAIGEEPDTIEEVHEPFLLQEGFLMRTPRGRAATDRAYKHLGRTRTGTLL